MEYLSTDSAKHGFSWKYCDKDFYLTELKPFLGMIQSI